MRHRVALRRHGAVLRCGGERDGGPGVSAGIPSHRCERRGPVHYHLPRLVPGPSGDIHFKVRSAASATSAYEFTSQLFFDDDLTDQVHAEEPYASKGQRDMLNSEDGIYSQGGSQLVLAVTETSDGYAARFDIALEDA
jgi:hypothetical protein